jgi:hypothetical protein
VLRHGFLYRRRAAPENHRLRLAATVKSNFRDGCLLGVPRRASCGSLCWLNSEQRLDFAQPTLCLPVEISTGLLTINSTGRAGNNGGVARQGRSSCDLAPLSVWCLDGRAAAEKSRAWPVSFVIAASFDLAPRCFRHPSLRSDVAISNSVCSTNQSGTAKRCIAACSRARCRAIPGQVPYDCWSCTRRVRHLKARGPAVDYGTTSTATGRSAP